MTSTRYLALALIASLSMAGPAAAKRLAAGSGEANRAEGACGARGGVMFPKHEGDPDSTYGCIDDDGHGIVCGGKTQTDKATCDTFMVIPPHLPTRNDVLLYEKAKAGSPLSHGTGQQTALTWTADDPGLQWGPCPAFLPQGCALAVLHGDPAKDNVDVLLKLPAKAQLPLHWHTSAERMVLVQGELHVTYEGQEPAVLKPGTYAYGPARKPHSGSCAGSQPCVLFIAFESPLDAVPVETKGK